MDKMQKNIKDTVSVKGIVTFTNFVLRSKRAKEIEKYLNDARSIPMSRFQELTQELSRICEVRERIVQNLVVLAGRAVFARRLIGDTTYTGAIDYGVLGTGSAAPASGNTKLGTEVFRKLFKSRTRITSAATLGYYYSTTDDDDTYEEFGVVIDGTASVDTGQLFSRVLTGSWVKTNLEAMTVFITLSTNAS